MKVLQGINGFIAREPSLSYNSDGEPRLYIRIGINHYEKRPNGAYDKLAPTFHDLVQFGRGAELSNDRFRKGDEFIAVGYVRTYERTTDGTTREDEQFVAYRLSHDPNTTTYEIHRRPRSADRENDRTSAEAGRGSASPPTPARTPPPPPAPSTADSVNP